MKAPKRPSFVGVHGAAILVAPVSLLMAWTFAFSWATQAESVGKRFPTLEEAVASLRLSTASTDTNALRAILGPAADELQNPDRVQSTNELKAFSSALLQSNRLVH